MEGFSREIPEVTPAQAHVELANPHVVISDADNRCDHTVSWYWYVHGTLPEDFLASGGGDVPGGGAGEGKRKLT